MVEGPVLDAWFVSAFDLREPADWGWLAVLVVGALLLLGLVLQPLFFLRCFLWLVTHTVYRLTVLGREIVPASGPALLVCNHVSYIDWLLIALAQKRMIRFVIWAPFARRWGVRRLVSLARAIPIDSSGGPRAIVQALRQASEALAKGDLVCIFAEGSITRTGFLLPFHRGFEQIVKKTPVPIIPVCLDHVWGSIFSYQGGRVLWKWPQELPYPVTVAFGQPLPPTAAAAEVRLAIQKLSADCAVARSARRRPVHRQFVRTAARHPFRSCVTDSVSKQDLNYGQTLAGAMLLAGWLRPTLGDAPMVGVWLPPGVGATLANIAIALLGKTSVNLNYTSAPESVRSAIRQCAIRHVLTSRIFTGKGVKLPEPDLAVNLEDLRTHVTTAQRLRAYLKVIVLPGFVLERWVLGLSGQRMDDLATVIFSSGSTGEPKGVMLTHQNIMANAESMIQTIDVNQDDRVLGILPFFHSFGYTVTLWVPLLVGARAVYHHDPRQAKEIGELCRTHRCTILLTTPTFLRFYQRRCDPEDFKTLRVLMCGAEKLPQALAREFEQKFGILPLEGYGCTELSPAASANVPDVLIEGAKQIGNKPGTIGHPLPGVAARIVHPETNQLIPVGQDGMLQVFGANVMKGYLGKPEQTAKVLCDGWYVTGDVARLDEDGFLTITGRLARFAKIGGEMVPLERVEDELNSILGTSERVCAVTAIPDEKRGERLVVLHLPLDGMKVGELCDKLGDKGMPNLWVPGARDFFQVKELPILGSGKLDLKKLAELALELVKG